MWLLFCSTAIYKILKKYDVESGEKRKGGRRKMPKSSGGTGVIYVESNAIDDVPPLLNSLINSCVSCTFALIPSQFYIIAALFFFKLF